MNDYCYVITGASSGIGAALAKHLAGKVGNMVLHARHSEDQLDNVCKSVEKKQTKTTKVLCDLAEKNAAKLIIEGAVKEYDRIDAIIANAGFPILKSFNEGSYEDIEYAFRGNIFSFFELARRAYPYLKLSPVARVVVVGSFTSHLFRTDMRQFPLSAASKGSIEIATRSLALTMAKDSITVNCIVPGYIEKDKGTRDGVSSMELEETKSKIPLGRIGKPKEVAAAIEFLLSEDAGYITGQIIHVNGGLI